MKLSGGRKARMFWALWIGAAGLAGGCDDRGERQAFTVMTQNVYYGFDVGPLLAAENPEEIPILAAQAFGELVATNFPERAEAMADEIARRRPHLIGLQEVALIRIQSPGDAVLGGKDPALTVVYDYLEILLAALASRGLDYRVAGKVQNVDVELPMIVDPEAFTFDDVRLTDFDVVLARGDVETSNVAAANFQAKLFVPSLGLEIPRGYVAVNATLRGGQRCRFATAHLEDTPFPEIQLAQAEELAAALASETRSVILVGDFNSPAPDGETCRFLALKGYADAWVTSLERDPGEGLTWGHASHLRNDTVQFSMRLDLVLIRPESAGNGPLHLSAQSATVWGDELSERTTTGLWPSDHAAVIVEIEVRMDGAPK